MNRLDESLRARLREAAKQADLLEEDTPDVANLMRQQGPALVKSGRRRHAVQRVSLALLIIAVPAAFAAVLTSRSANETKLACLAHTVPSKTGPIEGLRDLGYAAFKVENESQLSLETAAPCKTVLALKRGSVWVHARDLGGGQLFVTTPRGRVMVTGTMFKVATQGQQWSVDVVEGQVAVDAGGAVELVNENEHWETGRGVSALDTRLQETLRDRIRAFTMGKTELQVSQEDAHATESVVGREKTTRSLAPENKDPATRRPASKPTNKKRRNRRQRAKSQPPRLPQADTSAADKTAGGHREKPRVESRTEIPRRDEPNRGEQPAGEAESSSELKLTAEQRVATAEAAWKLGDLTRARALYEDVGQGKGATAEGAWVRLARLELDDDRTARAARALDQRDRFGRGFFGAEAAWLRVRIFEKNHNIRAAADAARALVQNYEDTPQGAAAKRWLKEHSLSR